MQLKSDCLQMWHPMCRCQLGFSVSERRRAVLTPNQLLPDTLATAKLSISGLYFTHDPL